MIRLLGPDPLTDDKSIFFYFAKCLARGLANTLEESELLDVAAEVEDVTWGLSCDAWGWEVSAAGGGELWLTSSEKLEKAPTLSFFLTTTATFLPMGKV